MHRETTCLLLSQEKLTFQMGKGLCRHEARPTHWTPTVTVLNPQQDDPLEKCLSFFLLLHSSQPGTDEANTHTTSGSVFHSSCAPHSRSVPSLTAHAVHFVGSGNPFQQPGLSHCPDRQHNPVSLTSCLLSCQVCTFPRTFIHFKDEEIRRTNEVNPDRGVSGCSTHFVVIKPLVLSVEHQLAPLDAEISSALKSWASMSCTSSIQSLTALQTAYSHICGSEIPHSCWCTTKIPDLKLLCFESTFRFCLLEQQWLMSPETFTLPYFIPFNESNMLGMVMECKITLSIRSDATVD